MFSLAYLVLIPHLSRVAVSLKFHPNVSRPTHPGTKSPAGNTQAGRKSNRVVARFLGADADGGFDVADKNLAVANLAGAGRADDRLGGLLDQIIGQDDFNFDLG